ncbi:MAG TPA: type I DNA topoisomerase [Candidatus Xenobia bacterium]|nr:type I DNA topoisomerase [Candidatus Xenobia bacterium]
MGKSLVIVESPAKSRTIGRYLGKDYVVKSSLGHIKDLPRKHLGVNVEKGFEPTYFVISGKAKVVSELRRAARQAEAVYLAADPDREGEAICAHLREVLTEKALYAEAEPADGGRRRKKKEKPANKKKAAAAAAPKNGNVVALDVPPPVAPETKFFRVTMNEITARGVKQAFGQPGQVDENLVNAQQARRILDRLVGYEVSPLLWDKVKRGLSAGRVQTVALRMVVEREREIRTFTPVEYWTIDVNLSAGEPPSFKAKLVEWQGRKLEVPEQDEAKRSKQFFIPNEEEARKHAAALEGAEFIVESVQQKERRRYPVPPFITSTLQQEAARKLRFSVKRTMQLAQRLYEGVEVGEQGSVGLITYMRTDSTRVSQDALAAVREVIAHRFGRNYVPDEPRFYRSKKGAQDAHEAIRPTDPRHLPEAVRRYLEEDEFKLYQLIWQRFVASQMTEAVFDQTTIDIRAGDYRLRATGSVPKFDGFLAVYEEGKDEAQRAEEEAEAEAARLPVVREGERLRRNEVRPEQHTTQPPPRYTEATLVKELEEKGIGRPSTYAAILSTILEREYVRKDKGRFSTTQLGEIVSDLLIKSFEDIFDIRYTARMEEELDEIEEGKLDWRAALEEFYEKFSRDLERAGEEMENVKAGLPTEQVCDRCGKPMLLRIGRHGLFLACSGYPDCTNTREPELDVRGIESDDTAPESETQYCENCGREMVIKRGRYGPFYACTGYPDCKTTKPLAARGAAAAPVPLEEACPQCGGQLQEKFGRYGAFIACSNYPECRYTRQKTLGIKCPECGQGELAERRARRGRRVFYGCSRYPECTFTSGQRPLPEPCPLCQAPLTYEKRTKQGSSFRVCRNKECEFEAPLESREGLAAAAPSAESQGGR